MIRKHWGVLLLALALGSIVAFPQLIAEHRMGSAFQGVHPLISDDEVYYLARAHETLDGHPLLGNPYLAEYKNNPGVQFWLPDTVLTRISLVVFGDIHQGIVFWDFVLPAIAVFLSYIILLLLTDSVPISLGVSALLNIGLFFIQLNRTPLPQLFILFLLALYALLRAAESKAPRWTVIAALTGGILFYVYPFYWTYWIVIVGLGCVASFIFIHHSKLHFRLAAVAGSALVIGTFYFVQTYQATRLPYYQESLRHISVITTHFPSGFVDTAFALAVCGLLAFAWYKRIVPQNAQTLLVMCATLAGAVALNEQVITGVEDLPALHYGMAATYTGVFALTFFAVYAYRYYKLPYQKAGAWLIGTVLIVFALMRIAPLVAHNATPQPSDVSAQRYGPILRWLDTNTKTDDVVYADETLSPYIPAYTRDNVFFSNWEFLSYVPDSEIEARFLGEHYFDGPLTTNAIYAVESELWGDYYIANYQHLETVNKIRSVLRLSPLANPRYPDAKVQSLMQRENILQQGSFAAALGGRRVDYVVWDMVQKPNWRLPAGLQKVYGANGLTVYAIAKS